MPAIRATPSRFDSPTGVTSGAPRQIGIAEHHAHDRQGDGEPLPGGRLAQITSGKAARSSNRGEHHAPSIHTDRGEVRRQQRTAVPGPCRHPTKSAADLIRPPPSSPMRSDRGTG